MQTPVIRFLLVASIVGLSVVLPWARECPAAGPQPVIVAATPVVKTAEIDNIVLMGTGFRAEEEIMLFFVTPDGQQADLGYALKPVPKPDKTGTWFARWNAKDYVKTKLVTGGAYKIMVTDADLRVLAQTVIFFQLDGDQKTKEKEKPAK